MIVLLLLSIVACYETDFPEEFFKLSSQNFDGNMIQDYEKAIFLENLQSTGRDILKAFDSGEDFKVYFQRPQRCFYELLRVEQKGHVFSFKTFHNKYLCLDKNLTVVQKGVINFTCWFRVEKYSTIGIRLVAFNGHYLYRSSNGVLKADNTSTTETNRIFRSAPNMVSNC